jgi:hypothetical protein
MSIANRKWILCLFIFVLLLAALGMTDASQAAYPERTGGLPQVDALEASGKIEKDLLAAISEKGSVDFIVRFTEQADLSPAFSMDWNARGEFVYNTLRETAAKSQSQAKSILEAAGSKYQTFIAGNDLYV